MSEQKEVLREAKVHIMHIKQGYGGVKISTENEELMKKLLDIFMTGELKSIFHTDVDSQSSLPLCHWEEDLEVSVKTGDLSIHRSKREALATHETNVELQKKGLIGKKKKHD